MEEYNWKFGCDELSLKYHMNHIKEHEQTAWLRTLTLLLPPGICYQKVNGYIVDRIF